METGGLYTKRKHYRVAYPKAERPRLKLGSSEFTVLDISEKGVRFQAEGPYGFQIGSRVNCTIVFLDGESILVDGEVLRIMDGHAAIYLTHGITFKRITQEVHKLWTKYRQVL